MASSRLGRPQRFAQSLRPMWQRGTLPALILVGLALIAASRLAVVPIEPIRTAVMDATAPVLAVLSQPATALDRLATEVEALADLRAENARLRTENERLMAWAEAARRLEVENRSLRTLLAANPDPARPALTARVIGDPGGVFVRSLVVLAGSEDGVAKHQAALYGTGLVGRVAEVGDTTARVLLITDLNSRIPVRLERTRHTAILAGDNSPITRLVHVPATAEPVVGDRVLTSGEGGVLPPDLPVGIVVGTADGVVRVQPLANLDRLEFVRLVDFGPVFDPAGTGTRPVGLP